MASPKYQKIWHLLFTELHTFKNDKSACHKTNYEPECMQTHKQATGEKCYLNALQWLKFSRPFHVSSQCRDVTLYANGSFIGMLKSFLTCTNYVTYSSTKKDFLKPEEYEQWSQNIWILQLFIREKTNQRDITGLSYTWCIPKVLTCTPSGLYLLIF